MSCGRCGGDLGPYDGIHEHRDASTCFRVVSSQLAESTRRCGALEERLEVARRSLDDVGERYGRALRNVERLQARDDQWSKVGRRIADALSAVGIGALPPPDIGGDVPAYDDLVEQAAGHIHAARATLPAVRYVLATLGYCVEGHRSYSQLDAIRILSGYEIRFRVLAARDTERPAADGGGGI